MKSKSFKATYYNLRRSFSILECDIADLILQRIGSLHSSRALAYDVRSLYLYAARDILSFLEEKTNCDIVIIID